MGFFYGKASDAEGYVSRLSDLLTFGWMLPDVREVEFTWLVALRLANYNPVDAKVILNSSTEKELYEAYLIYSYDNIPDDA